MSADDYGIPSIFKEEPGSPNGLLTGVPTPIEEGEGSTRDRIMNDILPKVSLVVLVLILGGTLGWAAWSIWDIYEDRSHNEPASAAAPTETEAAEGGSGLSQLNPLIPTAPVTPTLQKCSLPWPDNGASAVPVTTTLLIWASEDEGDNVSFDVYFGTAEPLPLVGTTEYSRFNISSLAPLTPNTIYYWRVVTRHNESGAQAEALLQVEGDTWSFTTEAVQIPTPYPTVTPQQSMASLEITGSAGYPGDLPYMGRIQVALSGVTVEVPVEVRCDGVMVREGAPAIKNAQPEGAAIFPILIPPNQVVTCRVASNGQECGQWEIKPGQDGETALLECVVFLSE